MHRSKQHLYSITSSARVSNVAGISMASALAVLSGVSNRVLKLATGKVGIDVTLDKANQHARLVGVGLLAVMRQELGSLDKVVRVGRVFGMVNAAPDFTDHPKVINGCSDLFVQVFGDRGRHARCAVGMASLPFNMTVEIEAVIEVA